MTVIPIDMVPDGCDSGQAALATLTGLTDQIDEIYETLKWLEPRIEDCDMDNELCDDLPEIYKDFVYNVFELELLCLHEKMEIII